MGMGYSRCQQAFRIVAVGCLVAALQPIESASASTGGQVTSADIKQIQNSYNEKSAYAYSLPNATGKDTPVASFKGKYVLIVNLARKSSYADQLPSLIKLSERFRDRGLVVIGIPSNDFGASEPGTDQEIQKAYADAKVSFPVMSVSKIIGDDRIPLYGYLTDSKDAPNGGAVHWNYSKFILDKDGKVIARLEPAVSPDSPEMISTIDDILAGKYKAKQSKALDEKSKDKPLE